MRVFPDLHPTLGKPASGTATHGLKPGWNRDVVPRGQDEGVSTSKPTADRPGAPAFGPATRAWFDAAFAAPTAAQAGAWRSISAGRHALVVAPTGSGKTLAAFLWSIDRLAAEGPPADATRRCRVLYVSPLKALAVDVERNLRTPLIGIRQAAARLGLPPPDITVGMRTGDTPADERRAFTKRPPDILITTPESLFLLLTSSARESLRGVETVIIDEVHAVCATKRGAHLALSLERLDALLPQPGAADRAVGHRPADRRDRPVPRRHRARSRSWRRRPRRRSRSRSRCRSRT